VLGITILHPVDEARYSRQIKLSSVGEAGQKKISSARVLVIGLGGLGSPVVLYLAAAGIGQLAICDFDVVEESNLQRQIIHTDDQVGSLKTDSAAAAVIQHNPACQVFSIDHQMDSDELQREVALADVVLDCSDNFVTRFAVNRECVRQAKPLVSAAAIKLTGQILAYIPGLDGPCYQCLYGEQYENGQTCESEGILGPVVGVMGTMQALQALLILLGHTEGFKGRLLLFDGLNMQWQQVKVPRNPKCPCCGMPDNP
jgi:molybdopterin-synthase adenylyltransferase